MERIKGKTVLAYAAASFALAFIGARWGALIAERYSSGANLISLLLSVPVDIVMNPLRDLSSSHASIMGLLSFALVWILFSFRVNGAQNTRPGEEYGSARRGNVKDAAGYKDTINPENNILITKNVGIQIRPGSATKSLPNRNILIVGGSGTGKSSGYVEPNIMQIGAERDMVVIDPSGTILNRTGMLLVEAGYDIRVFDTKNPEQSDHWNMLSAIHTHSEVLTFVECLVSNTNNGKESSEPIWDNGEKLYYRALITWMLDWAPREDFSISTFFNLTANADIADDGEVKAPSPLDKLFNQLETGLRPTPPSSGEKGRKGARQLREENVTKYEETKYVRHYDGFSPANIRTVNGEKRRGMLPTEDEALNLWHEFRHGAGKTLKSFIISSHTRLAAINDKEIKELLSGEDEIHLELLGQTHDAKGNPRPPTVIFVIQSDFDGKLNCLMSIFMWQAIFFPMNAADTKHDGVLPRPVSLVFDEFKNVGKLPSFDQCISTVRKRDIDITVILQNLSQLISMYGESDAATIRGNCPTTVFLGGGRDYATAKVFAEESGKETITQVSTSKSGDMIFGQSTTSYTPIARDVFDTAELALLPGSKAAVYMGDVSPFTDDKSWNWKHPRYMPTYMFDPKNPPKMHYRFDYLSWKKAGRPRGEEATIWRMEYEAQCDLALCKKRVDEAVAKLTSAKLALSVPSSKKGMAATLDGKRAKIRVEMAAEEVEKAQADLIAAEAALENLPERIKQMKADLAKRRAETKEIEREVRREVRNQTRQRAMEARELVRKEKKDAGENKEESDAALRRKESAGATGKARHGFRDPTSFGGTDAPQERELSEDGSHTIKVPHVPQKDEIKPN